MVLNPNFCKAANLWFHSENPKVFVQSQWQSNEKSLIFLIYRWILAAFYIGVVAYSWTNAIMNHSFSLWFIYMTSWGIFLGMMTTTFGGILTTLHHVDAISLNPKSASYKVYWFLSNVSTVLAFLITIIYWSVLFDGKTSALDVLIHGGNSVGMFIELLVASHPLHFFHFVHTVALGVIYLLFTIIFYLSGGEDFWGNRYIYPVLNWENTGSATAVAIGIVVLGIFLHIIVCLIQKARYRVYKKFFKKSLPINDSVQRF